VDWSQAGQKLVKAGGLSLAVLLAVGCYSLVMYLFRSEEMLEFGTIIRRKLGRG
jgi:hypothetical protein